MSIPGGRSQATCDSESFCVDLGDRYYINQVVLRWAASYGTKYRIQLSDDAKRWSDVYVLSGGRGGTDTLPLSGNGRYVRMSGMTRADKGSGYSLNEIEVFGVSAGA